MRALLTQLIKDVLASCKYCCQRNVPEASCAVSSWPVQFRQLVQRGGNRRVTLSPVCVCVCVWASVMSMNYITYRYIEWRMCVLIHAALAQLWCSCQRFRKVQNWKTGQGLMPITLHSWLASVLWSFEEMWPPPLSGPTATSNSIQLASVASTVI